MATPTIPNGEEYFFPIIYEGNGAGQRVGKFVPFTDNGTIDNSCIFNDSDDPELSRTPSSETNRDTWTLSFWIKRCNIGALQIIFQHGADVNNCTQFSFDSSNRLQYQQVDGGSNTDSLVTNRTFEDTSKFYHILLAVDTTQATEANRIRMYVDGDEITSWNTANYPTQNTDTDVNTTTEFSIGRQLGATTAYSPDCYFAEMNFVDGTQLTPSTFGVTDTSTGRWIPKTLSGITYGTNGFRLKFQDSSALGDDTSGNGNDLTATNLASTDQTTDSPSSNHNTFGSSSSGTTLSEGNLTVNTGTTNAYAQVVAQSGFGVKSGKWYWEVKVTTVGAAIYGWKDDGNAGGSQASTSGTIGSGGNFSGGLSTGGSGGYSGGSWYIDHDYNNEVNYTTVSTNDVLMFAMDLDTGKGYCGKNGTWFNSANPANGTGAIGGCHRANGINKFYPCALRLDSASVGEFNFGQRSFAYTAPTGFSALQQDNLPTTDKGITGMVWIKNRDEARSHVIYDSSRGPGQKLQPDKTNEDTLNVDGVTRFLKGGVAVGSQNQSNDAGDGNVAWNWVANSGTTSTNTDGSVTSTVQVNTTAGFSIVRWTGGGSAATVGHGLSQTPEWIFYKRTSAAGDGWITYHTGQNASPANGSLQIQSDGTFNSDSTLWNNTAPTSSVISIGSYGMGSGEERTAWVWHSVDGFSKFGKYVGNGSADGPFVYLGFRPAFVCIKRLTAGYHWTAKDTTRDPINPMTRDLKWNLNAGDNVDANNAVDFLSNGFKIRSASSGATNYNGSGATHIYMAWAEHPFVGDGTSPVTAR